MLSDAPRPTANVTATTPNTIAANVVAVLAGRANGPARPSVIGRGSSRIRLSSRCAAYPRVGLGARPVAMAAVALIRPARIAISSAAVQQTANMASGTTTSTQADTASAPTP